MSNQENQGSPKLAIGMTVAAVVLLLLAFLAMWPEQGEKGGKCNPDGSCNMGLVCKSQKCEVIPKGALRGECRPNGGCNEDLNCNKYNFCDQKGEEPKKPKTNGQGGGGLVNDAKRKAGAVWRVLTN
jgi:hypothetical protein